MQLIKYLQNATVLLNLIESGMIEELNVERFLSNPQNCYVAALKGKRTALSLSLLPIQTTSMLFLKICGIKI
jgi:hypothetical protein